MRRVLDPVVRLLAGVPSVIYGLIGILASRRGSNEHLISNARKQSVAYVVQLNGNDLMTRDADPDGDDPADHGGDHAPARSQSVPLSWREGSAALGVNRWRTIWRVSVRTARPAIAAAAVLATARALGEAIMLAMVSGGRAFAANPLDGIDLPVRAGAAARARRSSRNSAASATGPVAHTIYAIAAVLLVSAALLSFAGWAAKQPLKRYGIGV